MTAYDAQRAEREGAVSGFHVAVGYLTAAAAHGRAVDPATLLELMTAHADRTAAIWRSEPAEVSQ